MKKLFSLILAAVVLFSCTGIAAEAETAPPIAQFNADGKFNIMLIADLHADEVPEEASRQMICEALDKYTPDLVVYLGDNAGVDGYDGMRASIAEHLRSEQAMNDLSRKRHGGHFGVLNTKCPPMISAIRKNIKKQLDNAVISCYINGAENEVGAASAVLTGQLEARLGQ